MHTGEIELDKRDIEGIVFEDAGEHDLKGVPDRWHLYRAIPST